MRRIIATLATTALLATALAVPATAITKNYEKDFIHPFVGLIAFYDGEGEFSHRCTGELLAPTVVLTAGHCTDNEAGGVMASARIWFRQDAGTRFDGTIDPVTGYADACNGNDADNPCATAHEMYNYGFDNFAGFPNTHDVGIVILDESFTSLGFATLAEPQTLDPLLKARGTQEVNFTVSGYGISQSSKQGTVAVSYRERLMATEKLVNLNAPWNDGYNVQLNGNGNDRGGTCSGDSGGPLFWPPNTNQIVGVTSFGKSNAGCRGDGYYYRTDRADVINWIISKAGSAASQITVGP